MARSFKLALLASVCAAGLFAAAPARAESQDVVRDARDNVVVSTNGECVRTKWEADNDACAKPVPQQARVTPAVKSPAPRKEEAPQDRSYLVFFDWDKSAITQDARDVLAKVAERAKAANASLQVTGHADRSGPDAYNVKLSERRAKAVEKELEALGLSAGDTKIDWKGEKEPLVSTADGIREPQNRRAEIHLEGGK